jgi:hypothetical protein
MEQNLDPTEPATSAARKVVKDDAKGRAPNPERHFASPEMMMADDSLTDFEKKTLLKEWSLDLDNRLRAEEEGLGASDPMRGSMEARLADEARRVQSCLNELAKREDSE